MDKYDIEQILKAVGNNTGINTDTLLESLPKRMPTINTKTTNADNELVALSQSSPVALQLRQPSPPENVVPILTTKQPVIQPITQPVTQPMQSSSQVTQLPSNTQPIQSIQSSQVLTQDTKPQIEGKKKKNVKINNVPKYISNDGSDGKATTIIINNNNDCDRCNNILFYRRKEER